MLNKLTTNPDVIYNPIPPFVYWDGCFTEEELQKIDEYCSSRELEKATTSADNEDADMDAKSEEIKKSKILNYQEFNLDYRKSKISMCHASPENDWIFQKLFALVDLVNNNYYNFNLHGFSYFQYTEYEGPGEKYDEHMDLLFGENLKNHSISQRKLSFSLILSDSTEYTGGEFELNYDGSNHKRIIEQKRGRFLFFPSFILHGVKPVITGKRRSLVAWVVGPKFR